MLLLILDGGTAGSIWLDLALEDKIPSSLVSHVWRMQCLSPMMWNLCWHVLCCDSLVTAYNRSGRAANMANINSQTPLLCPRPISSSSARCT